MLGKTKTAMLKGMSCTLISVECDVSDGLPMFEIVGYLGSEVRETRERIMSAIRNLGIILPAMKITMNYSPAYLHKQGTGFDLASAVALLIGYGILTKKHDDVILVGEMGLDGSVRRIDGVLPILVGLSKEGYKYFIGPKANANEAGILDNIMYFGVSSLKECIDIMREDSLERVYQKKYELHKIISFESGESCAAESTVDFSDIKGQKMLKRACEVAACGMHNLLMIGPPGAGKSMIANAVNGILPELTMEEMLDVASIYSVAGLLKEGKIEIKRPFRNPHHSISLVGLSGGGTPVRPGEISLANHGVLFLDELPEFKRSTLEVLRQPMEEGVVRITRASGSYTYPAAFSLISAMNPCPCGYYPDFKRCSCSVNDIRKYLKRVSGPLLNRIDICVEANDICFSDLISEDKEESSLDIRKRVKKIHDIQKERFANENILFNSQMNVNQIKKYCELSKELTDYLEYVYEKKKLGARVYHRVLRVSRTIADMNGRLEIKKEDVDEALLYRGIVDKYWGCEE